MSGRIKDIKVQGKEGTFSFQLTPPSLAGLLQLMPPPIIESLAKVYGDDKNKLVEQILLAGTADLSRDIKNYINKTNRKSSFWMATENLLTSSPINNLTYLLAKLSKKKQ